MLCVSDSNFTPAYSSDGALYRRFCCAHFRSPQLHQSWRIANDDDAFEVQAACPNPALLWEHTVQGDCWANAQPRSRLVSTRARYLLEQGLRTNAARGPSQLASAHGWDATKSCALTDHPVRLRARAVVSACACNKLERQCGLAIEHGAATAARELRTACPLAVR